MKHRQLKVIGFALFVLISSAVHARAQAPAQTVAHIPFDFHVRGERFAAGDYFVTGLNTQAGSTAVLLRSRDGKVGRIFLMTPAEPGGFRGGDTLTLTFSRYGADHFLAEVRSRPHGLAVRLPKSESEKTLARLRGRPQTLTVPACAGQSRLSGT